MTIICVIMDTIGGEKYVSSVTGPDWKRNPHSIQPKRIHISYLIYNSIKHILSGHWSVRNVMVLSQLFGWVLSSHLSSRLLARILSAQIRRTTPAGSLNITAFFTSPIGFCVYTIWLVFFLSFPPARLQHLQSAPLPARLCQCMLRARAQENSWQDLLQIQWCRTAVRWHHTGLAWSFS